jgi:hypothetical protein
MTFQWVAWSNPVAIWWAFLVTVSAANIALLLLLHSRIRGRALHRQPDAVRIEILLLLLCAAYVFGCAFRSVLPRADVQRICLFDTWLSSVLIGRSVATIAEVCFAAQWAIVLRQLAAFSKADTARNISILILPLILVAEGCSWYAVITTSYLGNAIENSIWAVTFLLIAIALVRLLIEFHGVIRLAIAAATIGIAGYLAFLVIIDVPMYVDRWQADVAAGKQLLGIFAGLSDLSTRWTVTHDVEHWKDEIAWMSLYFSAAVWASLALCGFAFIRSRLPHYCSRIATARLQARPLPARVRTGQGHLAAAPRPPRP